MNPQLLPDENKEPQTEDQLLRVNVKPTSISVLTDPLRQFHFDYNGRLIGFSDHGKHYRLGLDGQLLFRSSLSALEDRFVPPDEKDMHISQWGQEWHSWLEIPEQGMEVTFIDCEPFPVRDFISKTVLFSRNISYLQNLFGTIWGHIPIVPPEFYQSVIVNFTSGCSFDACTFCSFYKDRKFRIKSQSEINEHLNAISEFIGEGITARRDLFIGEANALVVPNKRFLQLMEELNDWRMKMQQVYPRFRVNRIGTFIDGFSAEHRSDQEWQELQNKGLTDIAIGVETGHPELLAAVGKPYQPELIIQTINRLKNAGFTLQLIFLVGLGGKTWKEPHLQWSERLISNIDLADNDRIQLSLFNPTLAPSHYPFKDDFLSTDDLEFEFLRWKNEILTVNPDLQVRKYPTRFFLI